MEDKYNVSDLIAATVEQRPTDFEAIFNDILVDKLNAAVENRKIEVAQSMFDRIPEPEEEE